MIGRIKHSWTWEVQWIPRELNDAADALSKNDMQRFSKARCTSARELDVLPEHLAVPDISDETSNTTAAARSQRKVQFRLPHGGG